MRLFDVYPIQDITIQKALGSTVWDDKGQEYLDLYGGHAVISIGHTHPHWVNRIEKQLHQIAFYSNSIRIPIQQELATKLGQVSGKEEYQLFCAIVVQKQMKMRSSLPVFIPEERKWSPFQKHFTDVLH